MAIKIFLCVFCLSSGARVSVSVCHHLGSVTNKCDNSQQHHRITILGSMIYVIGSTLTHFIAELLLTKQYVQTDHRWVDGASEMLVLGRETHGSSRQAYNLNLINKTGTYW